jgi:hemerythrin-like domain-containing protein
MTEQQKSDLIDLVHHEHHHMTRLFEDLRETFERLASEDLEPELRREIVETAHDDLQTAFDELLHHFSQEEEVFFVELEKKFPALGDDIAELVATHEFVCDRTRWLQKVLHQDASAIAGNVQRVRDVLTTLESTLVDHTNAENEILGSALRDMTPEERNQLLEKMRAVG